MRRHARRARGRAALRAVALGDASARARSTQYGASPAPSNAPLRLTPERVCTRLSTHASPCASTLGASRPATATAAARAREALRRAVAEEARQPAAPHERDGLGAVGGRVAEERLSSGKVGGAYGRTAISEMRNASGSFGRFARMRFMYSASMGCMPTRCA